MALKKVPQAKNQKSKVALVRETSRLVRKLQMKMFPQLLTKYMEDAASIGAGEK